MDPLKVRPRDGWVVVLADPRKTETDSGILLSPNESGIEKVTEGSGTLIRLGTGEENRNEKLGLKKNDRIVYRGFLKHANPIPLDTDEKWPNGQKKTYFIMSSDDILGVMPEGVEVGVFSGRPQVPEKKP